jgi:hypothetical protein
MSVGEKIGSVIGTVVGTVIGGPIGTVAGPVVGGAIGDAIEDAIDGQDTAPTPAAPPAKPLIASKSAWFGLLFAVIPPVLQWGLDFDWTQIVSPTWAALIGGVCFIGLRIVTTGPIGRG